VPQDWYCTSAVQPGLAAANESFADLTASGQPVWASLISQTVSLPLAHLAPLAAVVGAGADVAATALLVGAAVVAAVVVVAAAEVVPAALVELELLPHADAVSATAIPTDAT
jgi:hypothetical protein